MEGDVHNLEDESVTHYLNANCYDKPLNKNYNDLYLKRNYFSNQLEGDKSIRSRNILYHPFSSRQVSEIFNVKINKKDSK